MARDRSQPLGFFTWGTTAVIKHARKPARLVPPCVENHTDPIQNIQASCIFPRTRPRQTKCAAVEWRSAAKFRTPSGRPRPKKEYKSVAVHRIAVPTLLLFRPLLCPVCLLSQGHDFIALRGGWCFIDDVFTMRRLLLCRPPLLIAPRTGLLQAIGGGGRGGGDKRFQVWPTKFGRCRCFRIHPLHRSTREHGSPWKNGIARSTAVNGGATRHMALWLRTKAGIPSSTPSRLLDSLVLDPPRPPSPSPLVR